MPRLLRPLFARLPLTDRVTYWHELCSGSLSGVFQGLGLSLVSIIGRKIGMNAAQIAVMLSMPFAGSLLSLGFGHFVRPRAAVRWVFWPNVAARVLLLGVAFATTPASFMSIMCAYYIIASFAGPAYASVMKTNYSDGNRGKLMSRIRIVQTAIVAVAAAVAGGLLQTHPQAYRWLVPLAASFGIASVFIFGRLKVRRSAAPAEPTRGPGLGESLRAVAVDRTFLILMAIFFICAGAPKLVIPLEPIRLVDELAMDYRQAGLITGTTASIASVLGYWLWGRLSARRHPMRLMLAVFCLGMLRNVVMALARTPAQVIPASIVSGLSNSGYDLVPLFVLIHLAGPGRLPVYFAFHNSLVGVRGLIGPYLGTALHDGAGLSITAVYWVVAGICSVGVLAMAAFVISGAAIGPSARRRAASPRG